jgi:opacity protein-like surface antigen
MTNPNEEYVLMSVRKWLITTAIIALVAAAAPRTASADWVLTPFLGVNFGGSADVNGNGGTTFSTKFEHKIDYGASLAGMGRGPFGFEVDFGYSPNFFATTTGSGFQFTNASNATTLTGNLVIGAPAARRHGGQVRPYVVGGVGLVRTKVQDAGALFDVTTKNDFGFDVGGGVMGFFSRSVGIRGDVRYFRGFRGSSSTTTGLGLSNFEFWRASVGLSLKF